MFQDSQVVSNIIFKNFYPMLYFHDYPNYASSPQILYSPSLILTRIIEIQFHRNLVCQNFRDKRQLKAIKLLARVVRFQADSICSISKYMQFLLQKNFLSFFLLWLQARYRALASSRSLLQAYLFSVLRYSFPGSRFKQFLGVFVSRSLPSPSQSRCLDSSIQQFL